MKTKELTTMEKDVELATKYANRITKTIKKWVNVKVTVDIDVDENKVKFSWEDNYLGKAGNCYGNPGLVVNLPTQFLASRMVAYISDPRRKITA